MWRPFKKKRRRPELPVSDGIAGDVMDAVVINEVFNPGSTAAALGAVADVAGTVGGAAVDAAGAVVEVAGEVLDGGFDG